MKTTVNKFNMRRIQLNEVTRWDIIRRSQQESPERYRKLKNYKAKDFKNLDFVDLFDKDIFTWSTNVGDYIVTVSFDGAFEALKHNLSSMRGKNRWKRITLGMVVTSLSKSLDEEDIYVNCSCPDFLYRFSWWATKADCKFGKPQTKPPTVRNVNNNIGYACKHILAVLYGKRWVGGVSKAWLEYMKSNPELTEFYIWGKPLKNNQDNQDSSESTEVEDTDEV